MFNSDYKDKHSEKMRNGGNVKYSYVVEEKSRLTLTTKQLQTEEHIFEGSLTVELGSLIDNYTGNGHTRVHT